jgi:LPXTG-motif cell wall-anchored protein
MCMCKDEQNKPCPCWKKWALVGLGLAILAGLGYWIWKKQRSAG